MIMLQKLLFSLCEFFDSFNIIFLFFLTIASVVFTIYFINIALVKKRFKSLPNSKKAILLVLALLSLLVILELIVSYDIYPNLESEILAQAFAESICSGKINNTIEENNNSILATDYFANFINTWRPNSTQFSNWFDHIEYSDNWRNSLHKIDEHYTNIDYYETYDVVYQISPITHPFTKFDLLFDIRLRKRIVKSRFIGSYERWRVTHFSFDKKQKEYYN